MFLAGTLREVSAGRTIMRLVRVDVCADMHTASVSLVPEWPAIVRHDGMGTVGLPALPIGWRLGQLFDSCGGFLSERGRLACDPYFAQPFHARHAAIESLNEFSEFRQHAVPLSCVRSAVVHWSPLSLRRVSQGSCRQLSPPPLVLYGFSPYSWRPHQVTCPLEDIRTVVSSLRCR
jgi:hypothetical protein